MKYFIVRKGVEFVIYKVASNLEDEFKQKYSKAILIEEVSLIDALVRFEQEIMFSMEFMPDKPLPPEKDAGAVGAQPASDKEVGGDNGKTP